MRGYRGSRHPSERSSKRTQKRGRLCNPRWRRPNDKRRRFLPRRSTLPERKALHKAEHDKEVDAQCVADGEDLLKKLKTQVADPTMPTLLPADLVGEVTRLEQMVVELQRQLHMEFPWSHHRVFLWSHHQFLPNPDSEEGGLCSSDGTRGVGVDGRPSKRDDCCSNGQESHGSSAHDATRSLQPESVLLSMGTASKEARTISGSRWVRLRIQVLPNCADCAEDPKAGSASV